MSSHPPPHLHNMSKTATTATTTSREVPNGPIKRVHTAEPVVAPGPTLLPSASQHRPNGQLPNTPLAASVISACLGGLVAASAAYLSVPYLQNLGSQEWAWARPQFALYGAAMGVFHLWEFWSTAGWNPNKLSVDGEITLNSNRCEMGMVELMASFPAQQRTVLPHGPPDRCDRVPRLKLLLAREIYFILE